MTLHTRIDAALDARASLFDPEHYVALRLFDGFVEGPSPFVVDLYARTLLLHARGEVTHDDVHALVEHLRMRLPWVRAAVLKLRRSQDASQRNGVALDDVAHFDHTVHEGALRYAVDLQMHRDAGLYLDTRNLRRWLYEHAAGWRVLNTFAYTGSLGVAALAGGARRVVQLDRSARFLNVARRSYGASGLDAERVQHRVEDFYRATSRMRREGALFECVIVDPPLFSTSDGGTVDMLRDARQVIDKVRPLVADGGWLVAVNNALWAPGAAWLDAIGVGDGYLSLETTVEVPGDCVGLAPYGTSVYPSDPRPFGHPTKIAVLRVRRKDGRR